MLAVCLLSFSGGGLMHGITEHDHWDIDTEEALYRWKYQKIKEWHGNPLQQSTADLFNTPRQRTETERVPVSSKSSELTERDWKLIMSGSSIESYKKGEVIVKQGSPNSCLYRIKSGTVIVERFENGRNQELATMSPGQVLLFGNILDDLFQMFGEMSVLSSGETSATIRAQSDTEIYKADVAFMRELFNTEPGMRTRFFKKVAIKLAQRLRELGQAKDTLETGEKKFQEEHPQQQTTADKEFGKIFGLPQDEVVIQGEVIFLY